MNSPRRFRVALSFPRGQREYVKQVADALAERFDQDAVLYDRYHTAEFADANLTFDLPDLYRKESDLIVVVLCGEYVEREWCGLEWRAIYSHIKEGNSKQVMLFRADDAEIPGLHDLEGFIPIDDVTPEQAVTYILQRLARNEDKPRDFYLEGQSLLPEPLIAAASRLPKSHDTGVFEGRDDVLAELDLMWDDALAEKQQRARVVSLVAVGGAGKTTVASRWKNLLLAREGHGGVERYFDWSFYSQGTRDSADGAAARSVGDATSFLAEALKFFGDSELADSPAPAWDKGARLAALASQHRTLLILDGLEPLQHPPGPQTGELQDDGLLALFDGLKTSGRGLCVVTTREPVADLAATEDSTTPRRPLDHLTDAAGAAVLKAHGVTGPDSELEQASREVKGHALTLSLAGRFLKLAFDPPDIAQRDCFRFEAADHETSEVREGRGHAFRVFAAYEDWLLKENREVEVAILRLLGLFDRPATPDCLAALCEQPLPGLSEPLAGLGKRQWTAAVNRLRGLNLIETSEWHPVEVTGYSEEDAKAVWNEGEYRHDLGPPQPFALVSQPLPLNHSLDAHPLLREYFAWRLSEPTAPGAGLNVDSGAAMPEASAYALIRKRVPGSAAAAVRASVRERAVLARGSRRPAPAVPGRRPRLPGRTLPGSLRGCVLQPHPARHRRIARQLQHTQTRAAGAGPHSGGLFLRRAVVATRVRADTRRPGLAAERSRLQPPRAEPPRRGPRANASHDRSL
tara:strand:+ start:244360 stop:246594 length:2235 start_codon:yes stop_codon:yes gene_type:complete